MATDNNKSPSAAAELRRLAEEQLLAKKSELQPPRNEELTKARDEVERVLVKLTDLYDFAPADRGCLTGD